MKTTVIPEIIAGTIAGHAETLAILGSKNCTARRLVEHVMIRYDKFQNGRAVKTI